MDWKQEFGFPLSGSVLGLGDAGREVGVSLLVFKKGKEGNDRLRPSFYR